MSDEYETDIIGVLNGFGIRNILKIDFENTDGVDNIIKDRAFPKLEITARIGCAIQCKFCPQKLLLGSYFRDNKLRKSVMGFDDYKICLSHMPNGSTINFAGFVEPFFHENGVDMIEYAFEQGFSVELFTTFNGLSFAGFQRIKTLPFALVVLHTPDKMNYAKIAMSEEYKKIIDEALDLYRPNGLPFIDSANCQGEPSEEFNDLARNRVLVTSQLHDRAGNLEGEGFIKCKYREGALICEKTRNMDHWVVLPDGTVVLCCMDFGMEHVIGNILENTYDEIMEGDAYKDIRNRMLNDGGLICRKCFLSQIVDNV